MPILSIAIVLVAVLAGSALFMSGYTLGQRTAAAARHAGLRGRRPSSRSGTRTTRSPTATPAARSTARRLIQGAIKGMIDALGDPYSAYLTSQEYRDSLQGISGQFEGIGAEIATQARGRDAGLRDARAGLPAVDRRADRRARRPRRPGSWPATSSSRPTARRSTG